MKEQLFSINRICQLVGISKNSYYNHQHPDERFEAKYGQIKGLVEKIIEKNNSYGIKRIKAALKQEYQLEIGRDALARLLNLWGLSLRRKIKKAKISLIKKILISLADRTNLLIRTEIKKPLEAITSDITEIYYNHKKSKAYLAVHKDVFGQMVYGWKLEETMETELVIESLERAKRKIKEIGKKVKKSKEDINKMFCHQDQGSQYTSYEYVDKVLKSGMRLSYSTPGTPTENPGQESFFGRLKGECQDEINEIGEFKKLEKFLEKRLSYYNKKRLHTSLNNQTPEHFTINILKKFSLVQPQKRFSFFRT